MENLKPIKDFLTVELIGKTELQFDTENPESSDIIYMALSQCYNKSYGKEEFLKDSQKKKNSITTKVLKSGHTSVSEHLYYTFLIKGLSLPAKVQLIRHRIASPTERSLRYTTVDSDTQWFVVPDTVFKRKDLLKEAIDVSQVIINFYNKLLDNGIPAEDARYFLFFGTSTNLVFTINARSLKNFFGERLCSRAQNEIRILANKMKELLIKDNSLIFKENKFAEPKCVQTGFCYEDNPCRKEFKIS